MGDYDTKNEVAAILKKFDELELLEVYNKTPKFQENARCGRPLEMACNEATTSKFLGKFKTELDIWKNGNHPTHMFPFFHGDFVVEGCILVQPSVLTIGFNHKDQVDLLESLIKHASTKNGVLSDSSAVKVERRYLSSIKTLVLRGHSDKGSKPPFRENHADLAARALAALPGLQALQIQNANLRNTPAEAWQKIVTEKKADTAFVSRSAHGLCALTRLCISGCKLKKLFPSTGYNRIARLTVVDNDIAEPIEFMKDVCTMTKLTHLTLCSAQINRIPAKLAALEDLEHLNITTNMPSTHPDGRFGAFKWEAFRKLETLAIAPLLSANELSNISFCINRRGAFSKLRDLSLRVDHSVDYLMESLSKKYSLTSMQIYRDTPGGASPDSSLRLLTSPSITSLSLIGPVQWDLSRMNKLSVKTLTVSHASFRSTIKTPQSDLETLQLLVTKDGQEGQDALWDAADHEWPLTLTCLRIFDDRLSFTKKKFRPIPEAVFDIVGDRGRVEVAQELVESILQDHPLYTLKDVLALPGVEQNLVCCPVDTTSGKMCSVIGFPAKIHHTVHSAQEHSSDWMVVHALFEFPDEDKLK